MWCRATFTVGDGSDAVYYTVEYSAWTEVEAERRAIGYTVQAGDVIRQRVTMPTITYPDILRVSPEQVAKFRGKE